MHRHPVDFPHLAAGLIYTVLGLAFLGGLQVADLRLRWLWPVALLVAGAVLLASSRASTRGGDAPTPDGPDAGPTGNDAPSANRGPS